MPKAVTNTEAEARDNPMGAFAAAFLFGASESIEMQEAHGQRELVASEQIPIELMHGLTEAMLESVGFVLGPPTPGDPLFRAATLPAGWSKARTDHSMWSKILDDRGRERFAVFYKAASYDRKAHMGATCRFGIRTEYPDRIRGQTGCRVFVTDGAEDVTLVGEDPAGDYDSGCRLRELARKWLAENRPRWEDPTAYWDEA